MGESRESTDTTTSPRQSASAQKRSRAGTIIAATLILMVVAAAGRAAYVYVVSPDGPFNWKRFAFLEGKPVLIPATGEVSYLGKPLDSGTVYLYPIDGQGLNAIAVIENDGRCTFLTTIEGDRVKGVVAGEYKVVVTYHDMSKAGGFGEPPRLIPDQYFTEATTPLNWTVESGAESAHFKADLTGDMPKRPAGRKGGFGGKKKAKGGRGKRKAKGGKRE
jgi:hypothetical protein